MYPFNVSKAPIFLVKHRRGIDFLLFGWHRTTPNVLDMQPQCIAGLAITFQLTQAQNYMSDERRTSALAACQQLLYEPNFNDYVTVGRRSGKERLATYPHMLRLRKLKSLASHSYGGFSGLA